MAYNKFIKKDGTVMLDLTDTTVSAETLAKDIIAVDKSGNKITGTLTNSPLLIEISTEEEMTTLLESGEVGSVYKYTGTTGTYENGALYEITEEESDPLQGTWVFNDTLQFNFYTAELVTRITLNYISNGINYLQLIPKRDASRLYYNPKTSAAGTLVYDNQWVDNNYKTIEITSTYDEISSNDNSFAVEDFFTWLQANATKQLSKTFAKLILKTDLEEITITENGEYTPNDGYSKVTVNVEDSPIPIEISTEEEMNELLVNGELNGVYKYVGETGTYEKYALYILKNTSTFASSDGYYITDADGTILVPKGDIEIVKLSDREDVNKYFEGRYKTVDLPYATRLKAYAFYRDGILNHINIPRLISIDYSAFEYCSNLALTELPSGLTNIGDYAFNGCSNLALTELPSGVTSINDYVFYNCSNLALTELPSGVTSIGYHAFNGCSNLALTELPSGVTEIGSYAFNGCTGLTNLTFKNTADKLPNIHDNVFKNCPNILTINVPWAEGEVENAPWGATNATINYGKLSAPTLSLDGTILTITDNDSRTTSFDILVDGEVKTTITTTTFDLATLGLVSDTYSVTAIAKTEELTSSSESSTIEYIVS